MSIGKQASGSMGGKARALKLTPEQRSASARYAINIRWLKKRVRESQLVTSYTEGHNQQFTFHVNGGANERRA